MKSENKIINEELKKIIIERLKQMPENLKVSLGGEKGFLNKEDMIKNIEEETETGIQLFNIQLNYVRSLKKGIMLPE